MNYQRYFQSDETPAAAHVSCKRYLTLTSGAYPQHSHAYYELSYVVRGDRYETLSGKRYRITDNTLFFYQPLVVHSNKNNADTDIVVIQFSIEFLMNNCSPRFANVILKPSDPAKPYITPESGSALSGILSRIADASDEKNDMLLSGEFLRTGLVLELVSELIFCGFLTPVANEESPLRVSVLDSVINNVLAHPEEKPDMAQAAKAVNMSYYSFSRFFKNVMGINYSEYCNLLRIRYAEDLLLNTDLSVSAVAAKIGIDVPSYFSRLFRQVNGSSPQEFRRAHRK